MTSSWMLVAGALFALMGTCAKLLSTSFTGAELSFYRSFFALIAIGGFVLAKRHTLRTPFAAGHFWRGLTGTISLVMYFYAITKLPLATAIALSYTSPLFLAVLSTLMLRERFRPTLVAAIVLGFIGVALLLRPTFEGANTHAAFMGLASGFFAALAYVNVKKLGDAGEPEWRVVFYFGLAGALGSALVQLFAVQTFHPITASNAPYLFVLGLAATLAQLAMTRAYHSGNTLVVGAFAYSTVLFSAIAGMVFLDERLPPIAWVGIAIIVLAGLAAKEAGKRVVNSKQADGNF
jgi:drug/metabolite transporter (DMT)-like permease